MKTVIKVISLSVMVLQGSCNVDTHQSDNHIQTQQAEEPMRSESVTGEVQEIRPGKDGYTAKIITKDSLVYVATISHANLKENANQYRTLKTGEKITIKGDVWKMEDEIHITVRELK